jgi:hypothetical protein
MTHHIKIPGEFALRDDRRAWLLVVGNLAVVLSPGVIAWNVGAWLANDPAYPGQYLTRPGYVGTALRYLFNRPFAGAGSGYPAYRADAARQPAE